MSCASKRANGEANGPVLYASISNAFYPMCTATIAAAATTTDDDDADSKDDADGNDDADNNC